MRAAQIRALLPDRLLLPLVGPHASSAALAPVMRGLLEHLVAAGAVGLEGAERDAVASASSSVLRAAAIRHAAGGWTEAALRVGARSEDPHVRGSSAAALDEGGIWEHAPASGPDGPFVVPKSFRDGVRVAEALASAIHDASDRRRAEAEARLPEAEAALHHEQDGRHRYDRALDRLDAAYRATARAVGRDRASAGLAALTHGRLRKGRALQAAYGPGAWPFILGAALGRASAGGVTAGDRRLTAVVGRLIGARRLRESIMGLAEDAGATLRTLGAAGLASSSARDRLASSGAEPVGDDAIVVDRLAAMLPLGADLLAALAPLTLEESVARLEAVAARPSTHAAATAALGGLISILAAQASVSPEASFGDWAGLPRQAIVAAPLEPGMRVWRRAARRSPALPARILGLRGRVVRPTALSDDEGRLVGYAAFDALSGEFHGETVAAVYALDGAVFGHLPDGGRHVRAGTPRDGFVTCPERLTVPRIFAQKEEA